MENDLITKNKFIRDLTSVLARLDYDLEVAERNYLSYILPQEMDDWSIDDYFMLAQDIKDNGLKSALHDYDLDDDMTADEAEESLDYLYENSNLDEEAYQYYAGKLWELREEGLATAGYKRYDYIIRDAKSTVKQSSLNDED